MKIFIFFFCKGGEIRYELLTQKNRSLLLTKEEKEI